MHRVVGLLSVLMFLLGVAVQVTPHASSGPGSNHMGLAETPGGIYAAASQTTECELSGIGPEAMACCEFMASCHTTAELTAQGLAASPTPAGIVENFALHADARLTGRPRALEPPPPRS